ncbi:precorrin-6A synthase (deacetylating) [Arachnia propionica]|uniref:Precorrin-6A synthase (Deacetylating) n=1 Tax=Arachnia propionica TaxID=1750 RepID=A0A3P1T9A1_9ACTN|nr:precorrin-6A synthase (deacetylating) [Arachnia propionica]RRD05755.1 precorrin-6A synthase (deacetylating) [Arachnia propionica]
MKVNIIGIGAGNPAHLSLEAIEAMREVDVFLVADKGEVKSDLVASRRALCEAHLDPGSHRFVAVADPVRGPDAERDKEQYEAGVADWHAARAKGYVEVMRELPADAVVGFLVWGDPAFYDSTIRIVERIGELIDVEPHVVPGITAFQALAAAHGIVLHEVGGPVHITTGRRLVDQWHPDLGMTVVMLDGHLKVQQLVQRAGRARIWWGANLGLPSQQLRSGVLSEVIDDIIATRARVRAEHGWVMDVYAFSM